MYTTRLIYQYATQVTFTFSKEKSVKKKRNPVFTV